MSTAPAERAESLSLRVAEEVRVMLARKRMSASKLSRTLGVSTTYVWRRLSGETAFDLDDLERIASVLQVDVMQLFPAYARNTILDYVGSGDRLSEGRPAGRVRSRLSAVEAARRPVVIGDPPMAVSAAAA